jgi:TPR repeat protein
MPAYGYAGALKDGHRAFDNKEYAKALKLWIPLAEPTEDNPGDPEAQYNIAILYMKGLGVEQNDRTALLWFTRAAQQGMADAQYNAGLLYYLGRGVYPSKKTAAEWWTLAVEKNHPNALHNLAFLYAYGDGVKQDPAKALKLWTRAAELGHPLAIDALIEVYRGDMKDWGFRADQKKLKYWQSKKPDPKALSK